MDFETVFTLLLLLLYLLVQFGGRKKRRARQPGRPAPPGSTLPTPAREAPEERSLQDALREIRSVLSGDGRSDEPEPAGIPAPQPDEPIYAEDRFERQPRASEFEAPLPTPVERSVPTRPLPPPPKPIRPAQPSPIAATSIVGSQTEVHRPDGRGPSADASDIEQILRRPSAAREAFLLSEIFAPPRSKRHLR